MYNRWYRDNMWLFVPLQQQVAQFMASLEGYLLQVGSSLSASDIGYQSLQIQEVLQTLQGIREGN